MKVSIDGVQYVPKLSDYGLDDGYVSEHFRKTEFDCNHCGKYGEKISNLLLEVLEDVRAHFGKSVGSRSWAGARGLSGSPIKPILCIWPQDPLPAPERFDFSSLPTPPTPRQPSTSSRNSTSARAAPAKQSDTQCAARHPPTPAAAAPGCRAS